MKLHYRLSWIFALTFSRILWGFRRSGVDAIPKAGPVIIASNHVSNWDPILLGAGCPREVHFMAKEELFRNPLLAVVIRAYNALPIRRGVLDRNALRAASEVLRNGKVLLMFPGGTRDGSGEMGDPKSGVGFIACMNEAPVVPAYIKGSNALSRAFVRGRGVEVAFGTPLVAERANSSDEYRAFSHRVADEIRRLKLEVDGR
ncbi:MAG: lysophospholipid acyltransferase family protein [Candidatus Eisenbacteria bacterium]